MFSFGSSNTNNNNNSAFSFGSSGGNNGGSSAFVFGSSGGNDNNNSFGFGGNNNNSSNNSFGFGTNNNTNNSNNSFFGTNTNNNNNNTNSFGFGTNTNTSSSGFGFGGGSSTTNTSFGGGDSSAFSFGGNNNNTNSFGTNNNNNNSSLGFGFGTNNNTNTNNNNSFGFGTNTNNNNNNNTGTNSFFGSGSGTGSTFGNFNQGSGMGGGGGTPTMQSFQPVAEVEKKDGGKNSTTIYYQSISRDPRYAGYSFEELRAEWLSKGGMSMPSNNTASSSFGFNNTTTTNNTNTTGFGSTTDFGFGTNTNTNTNSNSFGFGTNTNNTNNTSFGFGTNSTPNNTTNTSFGFGTNPTNDVFGNSGNNNSFSFSSNTNTAATNNTGTSNNSFFSFDSNNNNAANTNNNNNNNNSSFGFGFGTNNNTATNNNTNSFGFGGNNTSINNNNSSSFNFNTATNSTPSFGFDTNTNNNNNNNTNNNAGNNNFNFGFGGGNTNTTTNTTGGSSFGFDFGAGNNNNNANTNNAANNSSFNFGFGGTNTNTTNTAATNNNSNNNFSFGWGTPSSNTNTSTNFGATSNTNNYGAWGQPQVNQDDVAKIYSMPLGDKIALIQELAKGHADAGVEEKTDENNLFNNLAFKSPARVPVRPRIMMNSKKAGIVDRFLANPFSFDDDQHQTDNWTTESKQSIKALTIENTPTDTNSQDTVPESPPEASKPTKAATPLTSPFSINAEAKDIKKLEIQLEKPTPVKKPVSFDAFDADTSFTAPTMGGLPKLTKPGYYTEPSMAQIERMTPAERRRVVDFTVARKDHGQVKFHGVTDVTSLDLDKIVTIERKYVNVYPEDIFTENIKPRVGQELNKPSTITLFQVYPKDKITNYDAETLQKFKRKLIEATNRMEDAEFLNYLNGRWQFRVQHFTKYGLDDEEEEEEEEEQPQPTIVVQPKAIRSAPAITSTDVVMEEEFEAHDVEESHEHLEEEKEEDQFIIDEQPVEEEDESEFGAQFLPQQLNLNARKMQRAGMLFTDEEEEEYPSFAKRPLLREVQPIPKPLVPKRVVVPPPRTSYTSLLSSLAEQPEARLPSLRAGEKKFNIQAIPLSKSIVENHEKAKDAAVMFGKSFRVSFSADGTIVLPTFVVDKSASSSSITMKRLHVVEGEDDKQYMLNQYQPLLTTHFKHAKIARTPTPIASITMKPDSLAVTTMVDTYIKQLEQIAQALEKHSPSAKGNKVALQHFESVLKLIRALWGVNKEDSQLVSSDYKFQIARKHSLSQWLREQVTPALKKHLEACAKLPDQTMNEIFALLSANRISEAVQKAIKAQDFMLSTIISQCCGTGGIRSDMQEQVLIWMKTQQIHEDRLRIYKIISGDCSVQPGELDWKRNFGLHLWYKTAPDATIIDALDSYNQACNERRATLAVPPYIEEKLADFPAPPRASERMFFDDLLYDLLKLFTASPYPASSEMLTYNLAKMLHPLTSTSNLLDYRLTWHLFQILQGFGYGSSAVDFVCNTGMSFAHQLELAGLWHWAIYVTLQTNANDAVKARAVREILSRHVSIAQDNTEVEVFLKNELSIPAEWIAEAKALKAKYEKNREKQVQYLLESKQYEEAHTTILKYLAPTYILSENEQELKGLLRQIIESKAAVSVERRGYVYYSYIKAKEEFVSIINAVKEKQQITSEDVSSLQRMSDLLLELSSNLASWSFETSKDEDAERKLEMVAVSEMSSFVSNLMISVKKLAVNQLDLDEQEEADYQQELDTTIERMFLQESYRQNFIHQMILSHPESFGF